MQTIQWLKFVQWVKDYENKQKLQFQDIQVLKNICRLFV